jgi:hypothetical protein
MKVNDGPGSFEKYYGNWHKRLSMIKSIIRFLTSTIVVIAACFVPGPGAIVLVSVLAAGYGIAEIIGVLEEIPF